MKERPFALITGASCGIGKYLAIECARRKMNLVLISLPQAGLIAVADSIKSIHGIQVITYEGDLTNMNFIYFINSQLSEKNIPLSMLINNAGMGYEGRFEELPVDFCNSMMQLNMQSLVIMTRLFIGKLKLNDAAYILNVSSLASFTPMPFKSMYAASKSFVYSFSRALRAELGNTSISVSVLCPGAVPTNERVKKSIGKHGMFAKLSSLNPEELAVIAIDKLLKKQEVIIPGICNKLSRMIMKVIPAQIQLYVLNAGYLKVISVPLKKTL